MAEDQGFSQASLASTQLGKQQSEQRQSIVKNYCVSVTLVLIGFYFLTFAIVELVTNYEQNSFQKYFTCTQYQCQIVFQNLSFQIDEDVHIYLQNSAFTQYFLEPINFNKQTIISSCTEYITNQQINKQISLNGATLNPQAQAYPCGQIAMSYPQGNFIAQNNDNNQLLTVNLDGLVNYQYGFKNIDMSLGWADVQKQRFQVWSERNVGIGIKKYWGYISQKIPQNLKIVLSSQNKIYQKLRSGLKLKLTNNSAFSGYNIALTCFNFIQAFILFVMGSLSFWIISRKRSLLQRNNDNYSINEDDGLIKSPTPQYSYTINS